MPDISTLTINGKVYNIKDPIARQILSANGTVLSANDDFAEISEWVDGNPNNEDRIGYFVAVDTSGPGITMRIANSTDDVRGVTMLSPGFSGNASLDKFDENGNLLQQYNHVGWAGFVPVIDNGRCVVNGRCMPGDDGTAYPSTNNLGYQVISRIDDTHILVLIEPQADMVQRIKTDIISLENGIASKLDSPSNGEVGQVLLKTQDGAQWGNITAPIDIEINSDLEVHTINTHTIKDTYARENMIYGLEEEDFPEVQFAMEEVQTLVENVEGRMNDFDTQLSNANQSINNIYSRINSIGKIYFSQTQPTEWTSGDIWLKPIG